MWILTVAKWSPFVSTLESRVSVIQYCCAFWNHINNTLYQIIKKNYIINICIFFFIYYTHYKGIYLHKWQWTAWLIFQMKDTITILSCWNCLWELSMEQNHTTATPLYDTESWAVATGLSKTGNFMFPLLLLATVLNVQLLRIHIHALLQICLGLTVYQ